MKYRLYTIQYDEWGDEEERTIREGTNREQMETLFYVWHDWVGPHVIRLILEMDGDVLLEERFGGIYYDDD